MKRPIPSFTVEIRRRPGRAATPATNGAVFEAKPPRAEFDRDTDRAIAAIFGPKTASVAPVAPTPSAPAGRVLTSLVLDQPLNDTFDGEPSRVAEAWGDSKAQDEPAPRPRAKSARRSKVHSDFPQTSDSGTSPSNESPLIAVEALPRAATEKSAKPPRRERGSNKNRTVEISGHDTFAKTGRIKNKQMTLKNDLPDPLHEIAVPAATAVAVQATSAVAAKVASAPRKRMIMGRYVYGDEPKPGERWKHKLRKKW